MSACARSRPAFRGGEGILAACSFLTGVLEEILRPINRHARSGPHHLSRSHCSIAHRVPAPWPRSDFWTAQQRAAGGDLILRIEDLIAHAAGLNSSPPFWKTCAGLGFAGRKGRTLAARIHPISRASGITCLSGVNSAMPGSSTHAPAPGAMSYPPRPRLMVRIGPLMTNPSILVLAGAAWPMRAASMLQRVSTGASGCLMERRCSSTIYDLGSSALSRAVTSVTFLCGAKTTSLLINSLLWRMTRRWP